MAFDIDKQPNIVLFLFISEGANGAKIGHIDSQDKAPAKLACYC